MAALTGLFISVGYVAPFYLRPRLPRDDPQTIAFRTACTTLSCLLSWLPLWAAVSQTGVDPGSVAKTTLHLLGLRWDGLLPAVLISLALTAVLFAGPLVMALLNWRAAELIPAPHQHEWNAVMLRNLVISPVTEEFVFRACLVPLMLISGWTPTKTLLVAPLFFGVSHVHHVIQRVVFDGSSVSGALLVAAFQLAYTTLFGWYAAFLFMRTGHLAAPIAAHVLCNRLGFPKFGAMPQHPQSGAIVTALALGMAGFALTLRPATSPAWYTEHAGELPDWAPAVEWARTAYRRKPT